ncbi:MAG TPA: NlpC/P60 family protein [Acidimicrobiales bacterium]
MPIRPLRRRVAAGSLALALFAAPIFTAGSASGDNITDKKAEASKIADRLDALESQAEVYAEQYDTARLQLASLRQRVTATKAAVARTQRSIVEREHEVAAYAIGVYTRGGDDHLSFILQSNATSAADVSEREGYVSAAMGNQQDLVESLRTAKSDNQDRVEALGRAEAATTKAQATVSKRKQDAALAVQAEQHLYDTVTGQLRLLVAADEAQRAAAQAAAAQKRAEAAAAAAGEAAPPAAPADPTTATGPNAGGADDGGGATTPTSVPGHTPTAPTKPTGPAPTVPTRPAPPVGVGAGAAIAAARTAIGVPYVWGGASMSGFDCSGLVMWAWAHGGKSLPHSSAAMYAMSRRIPLSALQPGDLVFYGSPIQHVGLYIGGGAMIHAPHTGSYVQISSIYYWKALVGAGRV